MIDLKNLQQMIDDKYISVQKHPSMDLWIYNYTQRAQFDGVWNEETLACRGLIMNQEQEIVSRPFKKFFNVSEVLGQGVAIPTEGFMVTEKMDGSLGISYFDENGYPHLATRGSFVSDQAIRGQQILHNKYLSLHWNPSYTYLFEIIYPGNRIVVDYGIIEDIYLLAVIDTYTGEEFPYEKLLEWYDGKMPIVKRYYGISDFQKLETRPNAEGYVISFRETGQRYKIKHDEYVRLHRLVTGVNARTIWDLLRNDQPFDELLDRVPDEFFFWVKQKKEELESAFKAIQLSVHKSFLAIDMELQMIFGDGTGVDNYRDRKHFAMLASKTKYPAILFKMYDSKPYKDLIWKMLKPAAERPYTEEI